jgi:transcriptional regulator with XRE-family HTH domain
MSRNQRIKDALRAAGVSQEKLAERLNITQAAVGKQLNKEGDIDSIDFIFTVADLTGRTPAYLMSGDMPAHREEALNAGLKYFHEKENLLGDVSQPGSVQFEEYLKGGTVRPVVVTVDRTGRELISYVPVRAQAGYRRGFGDPHFVEKLPAYSLPINVSGTHRMFQVDGNSMRQLGGGGLNDGDIVIASYVEDIFSLKDGRVYVIVSTEGVIIKRCINRLLKDDRVLVANSDNKSGDYPAIILHPPEILEVWELKAYISKQLSLATDLWDIINDLQVKQALMADDLKQLKENKLLG